MEPGDRSEISSRVYAPAPAKIRFGELRKEGGLAAAFFGIFALALEL